MWLKNEPVLLHFVTSNPIVPEVMLTLTEAVFAEMDREISTLMIGIFDTREISGGEAIKKFVGEKATDETEIKNAECYSFDSKPVEGLERKKGADSELSLSFEWKEKEHLSDQHLIIRLRSHLFDSNSNVALLQFQRLGRLIYKASPSTSGFTVLNIAWRFLASYSGNAMYSKDGFPDIPQADYDRYERELFWYSRLARPTELMCKYGLFRNVYPYNFVCEEQLFTLKLLFNSADFPQLSRDNENKLSKRSRYFDPDQKPELPGEILDLGSHAALWHVPDRDQRAMAFERISNANLTLYRFFIDYKDLFPNAGS
ncbi:hypothetical protein [Roseibium sp. MMSF_3412]|uniref:hypothetical protein n=1 Tax=Roseibium sp. MMSF_3412 TaxID=3046712 RepID=UPI00273EAB4F|nr:hypothetical protein [Roseibium sp. MMSF_3412]